MTIALYRALCGFAIIPALCFADGTDHGRYGWQQITDPTNPILNRLTGNWVSAEYAYRSIASDYRQSLKQVSFREDGTVVWRRKDLAGGPEIVMTNAYSLWHRSDQGMVLYLAPSNHPGPWSEVANVLLRDVGVETNWLLVGDVLTGNPGEMFPVPAFFVHETKAQSIADSYGADDEGPEGSGGSPSVVNLPSVIAAFFFGSLVSAVVGVFIGRNRSANKTVGG